MSRGRRSRDSSCNNYFGPSQYVAGRELAEPAFVDSDDGVRGILRQLRYQRSIVQPAVKGRDPDLNLVRLNVELDENIPGGALNVCETGRALRINRCLHCPD